MTDWAGVVLVVVIASLFLSILIDATAASRQDVTSREKMIDKARRYKETERL